MIRKAVTVHTEHGLDPHLAGALAEYALKYPCMIHLIRGDKEVSAKSLLGVLSLEIRHVTELEIICDGAGETEAMDDMSEFINHMTS